MKPADRNTRLHSSLILVAGAMIWGFAFVSQSVGARYVEAGTFLAFRSWIAVLFLMPVLAVVSGMRTKAGEPTGAPLNRAQKRIHLLGGVCCGTALFLASAAQQMGIAYTTTAKAGFITALYVIIVPVLSVLLGQVPSKRIWFCVLLGLVGLYLLCMTGISFSLGRGDALMLLCAFLFSIQIMLVNYFSGRVDGLRLSFLEMLTEAVLATVFMLVFEHPTREGIMAALPALLYAGIMSSGVAYTFQIIGQKGTDPTVASLIMSLESVFSAIGGWLILHQKLSVREAAGCALMFMAIVISQLPDRQQ